MSPVPADLVPGRQPTEPHIRLLPSAFPGTAGGAPASPEAAYRAILETATDAILTIDVDGWIVAHNAAACRMFGYGPDQLLGANITTLVPEADRFALVTSIKSYVADAAASAPSTGLEIDACRADGSVFPVQLAIGEMGVGQRRLFTSIVRDISVERSAAVARAATEREREAFQRVTEAVATGAAADALFRLVSEQVAILLDAPLCVVVRFEGADAGYIVGSFNSLGSDGLDVGDSLDLTLDGAMSRARAARKLVRFLPDGDPDVIAPAFGERAAVVLRVAGEPWGALVAAADGAEVLGDGADRELHRFAQVIEVAVAASIASEALALRATQQSVVAELGRRAIEGASIGELFDLACEEAAAALPSDIVTVMETQGEGEILIHSATGVGDEPWAGRRVPRSAALITVAAACAAGTTLIEDVNADTPSAAASMAYGIRAALIAPIRLRHAVFGVISAARTTERSFTPDDRAFMQSIANVLAAAIGRAQDEAAMRRQSLHDPLTGLPNRSLLIDRLGQALARTTPGVPRVAILTCDFEGFARINEEAGHAVGDEVLRIAARRIAALLEPRDTLSRPSGDEFVVIREEAEGPGDVGTLGRRVIEVLAEPYEIGDRLVPAVSAGVGIALRGRGDDPEAALRDAETAAHRAHTRRRGKLEIFDESMREGLLARLELESDLRRMVQGRELRLHYQPLVSLADGTIDGFEALVRWQHPTRGLLPPGEFIDAAEQTGAIVEIGRWVITQACHDAIDLAASAAGDRGLRMSVNLSPRQLGDPGIVDHVSAALAESGLEATSLSLEITETVLMDQEPAHHERLAALRALGVKIVLDDFGTGYSSLGYLRGLALDGLKLDRSFVAGLGTDERATTIVAAVTQLAHALGLPVTAEGVETPEQVVSLQTLGCEFGQGYLFSRPVTRAAARELLLR